jgi:hypothetical protein
MAFDGLIAEQLQGASGMVVRTNRLMAQPGELIDANGCQFDNVTLRKEAGSTLLDPAGLTGAPRFTGTLAETPARWQAGVTSYIGTGVFIKEVVSSQIVVSSAGISAVPIPAAGVAAGHSLFVVVGITQGVPSAPYITPSPGGGSGVSDTKGNVYTQSQLLNMGDTRDRLYIFRSLNVIALTSSDAIFINTSQPGDFAGLYISVVEFSGLSASSLDRAANNEGGATTAIEVVLPPLNATPETLIAMVQYLTAGSSPDASGVITPTNGFVQRGTVPGGGSHAAVAVLSRVDTTSPVIIGLDDFNPQNSFLGTGTVSTTAGSQVVTGVGTLFLTEVNPNDFIRIGCDAHRVIQVISNTSLLVAEPWAVSYAAQVYTVMSEERLITATSDGVIYMELNGNLDAITLKTGLIPSLIPGRFVLGGKEVTGQPRKLFWFDGRDVVQVLKATPGTNTYTMADITKPPVDWSGCNQPVNGVFSSNSNRLIGFGNINDPHRIYFSLATDHEDFLTTPLQLAIYSGIGDRLWCGVSFNGLLMFWKNPVGIFFVDDSDTTGTPTIRIKSEGLGCAPSPHAVLPIDDDILFVAANGSFHLLSAVDSMAGTRASDLSYRLGISRWLRENVNLSRLNQIVSVWYRHKKQAFFAVPSAGSQSFVNDLVLKFDFGGADTGSNVRFSYSRRDQPGALADRREPDTIARPIEGEGAYVYLWDREARNKNGAPYTGAFQTPFLDFTHVNAGNAGNHRTRRKTYEHLEFVFEPSGSGTLVVQPVVDGQPRGTPINFNPTLRRDRQRIGVGDGHTFSVIGSESTLNGDFSIDDIIVSYNISDEDQSRGPR